MSLDKVDQPVGALIVAGDGGVALQLRLDHLRQLLAELNAAIIS